MNVEQVGSELGKYVGFMANRAADRLGVTYVGADSKYCPQTLAQIVDEYQGSAIARQPFRVSHDHCENTIYGSKAANMAFRFWHDTVHLEHGLETTLEDELRAGRIHVEACKKDGLSKDHQDLMWIDTCGQSLYNYITGEFPVDQMAYTKRVLALSLAKNLEQAVRMVADQEMK